MLNLAILLRQNNNVCIYLAPRHKGFCQCQLGWRSIASYQYKDLNLLYAEALYLYNYIIMHYIRTMQVCMCQPLLEVTYT